MRASLDGLRGRFETYSYISSDSVYEARKGTNGVSTHGVTANFMLFDRGTFCALPLTYFYLPKSARAYLFTQSVKISLPPCTSQDSSKGGAVETGCSGLHYIICCFII